MSTVIVYYLHFGWHNRCG